MFISSLLVWITPCICFKYLHMQILTLACTNAALHWIKKYQNHYLTFGPRGPGGPCERKTQINLSWQKKRIIQLYYLKMVLTYVDSIRYRRVANVAVPVGPWRIQPQVHSASQSPKITTVIIMKIRTNDSEGREEEQEIWMCYRDCAVDLWRHFLL